MDDFRLKRGFFGHDVAQNTVHKRSPVDWWTQYGDETPELMACAIRILSLTCSSSACERNWSTFNQIHTKKRNRLHTKNLNKMVYVMYNKRLKSKWMKKASLKVEENPLVMDEIPSDDEWVVHEDDMIVESDDVHGDGPEVHTQGDTASETITNPSGQGRNKGHPSKRRRLGKRKALQLIDEVEEDEEDDIILRDPIRDDFFINSEEENEGNATSFDPNFKPSTVLYGKKCWVAKGEHEHKVSVAEMKMLCWMSSHRRMDRITNEDMRDKVGEAHIVEKLVETRVRWFGHVERRPIEHPVRRVDQMVNRHVAGGRGRPKRTWQALIKGDLRVNNLPADMIRDRMQWCCLIHVADPT
ncbi:unnamed protein product [Cuscuta campestris]|uniref:HAT C-terminal dimerisation domain-containing protein n=1 Tax=Cuscuta campestris TaxID=132261 RepID=A0A484KVC4_9ASTE|nr:unnamed protein product [Cuscuta campestris]